MFFAWVQQVGGETSRNGVSRVTTEVNNPAIPVRAKQSVKLCPRFLHAQTVRKILINYFRTAHTRAELGLSSLQKWRPECYVLGPGNGPIGAGEVFDALSH